MLFYFISKDLNPYLSIQCLSTDVSIQVFPLVVMFTTEQSQSDSKI